MMIKLTTTCLIVALVASGCASDPKTIQNAAAANDQLAPAVMKDQQLADYIQQLGNRVVAAAKE